MGGVSNDPSSNAPAKGPTPNLLEATPTDKPAPTEETPAETTSPTRNGPPIGPGDKTQPNNNNGKSGGNGGTNRGGNNQGKSDPRFLGTNTNNKGNNSQTTPTNVTVNENNNSFSTDQDTKSHNASTVSPDKEGAFDDIPDHVGRIGGRFGAVKGARQKSAVKSFRDLRDYNNKRNHHYHNTVGSNKKGISYPSVEEAKNKTKNPNIPQQDEATAKNPSSVIHTGEQKANNLINARPGSIPHEEVDLGQVNKRVAAVNKTTNLKALTDFAAMDMMLDPSGTLAFEGQVMNDLPPETRNDYSASMKQSMMEQGLSYGDYFDPTPDSTPSSNADDENSYTGFARALGYEEDPTSLFGAGNNQREDWDDISNQVTIRGLNTIDDYHQYAPPPNTQELSWYSPNAAWHGYDAETQWEMTQDFANMFTDKDLEIRADGLSDADDKLFQDYLNKQNMSDKEYQIYEENENRAWREKNRYAEIEQKAIEIRNSNHRRPDHEDDLRDFKDLLSETYNIADPKFQTIMNIVDPNDPHVTSHGIDFPDLSDIDSHRKIEEAFKHVNSIDDPEKYYSELAEHQNNRSRSLAIIEAAKAELQARLSGKLPAHLGSDHTFDVINDLPELTQIPSMSEEQLRDLISEETPKLAAANKELTHYPSLPHANMVPTLAAQEKFYKRDIVDHVAQAVELGLIVSPQALPAKVGTLVKTIGTPAMKARAYADQSRPFVGAALLSNKSVNAGEKAYNDYLDAVFSEIDSANVQEMRDFLEKNPEIENRASYIGTMVTVTTGAAGLGTGKLSDMVAKSLNLNPIDKKIADQFIGNIVDEGVDYALQDISKKRN